MRQDRPARSHLRRQDPEGREACGSTRRAAEEVRFHHQSESSQADRPHDSAECVGTSGSGDQVILVDEQYLLKVHTCTSAGDAMF